MRSFSSDKPAVEERLDQLKALILSSVDGWTLDTLLDALVVLYDECYSSTLRREKCIADFIGVAQPFVQRIKELRLSKHDFDLVKTIGRGAFGDVVLAKMRSSENVFAVKILSKQEMLKRADTACFREERELLLRGDPRWVTKMHYAFQDIENLYFVLDYYPGGDLLTLLAKFDDRFSEKMAKFYCAEIAQALQSIHSLGYVHRDIKPDNVLLDWNGHVRLADFGSAIRIPNGLQAARVAVGTPDYISPEILQAMETGRGRYGTECDWWSVGCTLWEMLFGLPPFYANSLVETYGKIMRHVQKRLDLEFPEDIPVSDGCKDLLTKLLSPAEDRIGAKDGLCELRAHCFFEDLDFDNIHQQPAPYLPQVNGSLDTSNFDVETIEQRRALGGVASNKQMTNGSLDSASAFSGLNLPFVGFTFLFRDEQATCDRTILAGSQQRAIGVQTDIESTATNGDANKELECVLVGLEAERRIRDQLKNVTFQMTKAVDDMRTQLVADENGGGEHSWQRGRNAKACHMKVQEMEASLKQEQESKMSLQQELRQVKADNVAKSVRIESLTETIERLERQLTSDLNNAGTIDDHVHKFVDANLQLSEPAPCALCRGLLMDSLSVGICFHCDKLAHQPRCPDPTDPIMMRGLLGFTVPHRWNVERYLCFLTKRRFIIFSQNCQALRVFDRRCISGVSEAQRDESHSWRTNSLREMSNGQLRMQNTVGGAASSSKKFFRVLIDHPLRTCSQTTDNHQLSLLCAVEGEQQRNRWMKMFSNEPTKDSDGEFNAWRISDCRWKSIRCALIIDQGELWLGAEDSLWAVRLNKETLSTTAQLERLQQRRTFQLDKLSTNMVVALSGRNRSVRLLQRQPLGAVEEVRKLAKNVNSFTLTATKLCLFVRSQTIVVFDLEHINSTKPGSTIPCTSLDLQIKEPIRCVDFFDDDGDLLTAVVGNSNRFLWMHVDQGQHDEPQSCAVSGDPLGSVMLTARNMVLVTTLYGYSDSAGAPLRWPSQAGSYAASETALFVCSPHSGLHIYDAGLRWIQTISLINTVPLDRKGTLFQCSMQLTPMSVKDQHMVDIRLLPTSGRQLTLVHVGRERILFNSNTPQISPPTNFRHLTHIGRFAGQSIVQNIDSCCDSKSSEFATVKNLSSSSSLHQQLCPPQNGGAGPGTDLRSIHSAPPGVPNTEDECSSLVSHFSN